MSAPDHDAPRVAALIVAAGKGLRAGGGRPKQYRTVASRPLLAHTLAGFLSHPDVGHVIVAIHPDAEDEYTEAITGLDQADKLLPPIFGGKERQDSVRAGLDALVPVGPELVLIHDGARPLVARDLIARVIERAGQADVAGAIPALPVSDTLKRDRDLLIAETVDRSGLWLAQTPQGFKFEAIRHAHGDMAGRTLTDDAAVAEAAGLKIALVAGDRRNLKITTGEDFAEAERLLSDPAPAHPVTRVGMGFDVHRFTAGDGVILCGVAIPHTHKLEGHSDADVALHAVTDAVLGAIGAGDIGQHFPPSDARWRGAPSDLFLRHAAGLVQAQGGRISHVDVTIICERPKIGPHRQAMAERLADILGLAANAVNVKATTTEGLGFTGRAEGIAAQAVATVVVPGGGD